MSRSATGLRALVTPLHTSRPVTGTEISWQVTQSGAELRLSIARDWWSCRFVALVVGGLFLAAIPSLGTEGRVAASGDARIVCNEKTPLPGAVERSGLSPEYAFQFLETRTVGPLGYLACTFHDSDGEAIAWSRVLLVPMPIVVGAYVAAAIAGAFAWSDRPQPRTGRAQ